MKSIYSIDDLDSFICNNVNKYIILIYFGATWCNPCKELKNILDSENTKITMPKLKIAYIDVDNHQDDIAYIYNVKILPTQIFIKLNDNDKIIQYSKIEGYDIIKLNIEYNNAIQSGILKN